jgi:hypothetical protein
MRGHQEALHTVDIVLGLPDNVLANGLHVLDHADPRRVLAVLALSLQCRHGANGMEQTIALGQGGQTAIALGSDYAITKLHIGKM